MPDDETRTPPRARPADDPSRPAATPAGQLPNLTDAATVLALSDIASEWVPVPEWGVRVLVVGLSGRQRDDWENSRWKDKRDGKGRLRPALDTTNMRASLVSLAVRHPDEPTKRLFTDDMVRQLGEKSAAALERVFDVARRLSGLTDEDIEELTEELKVDPNGGSGSS